jgi:hypothetical protein
MVHVGGDSLGWSHSYGRVPQAIECTRPEPDQTLDVVIDAARTARIRIDLSAIDPDLHELGCVVDVRPLAGPLAGRESRNRAANVPTADEGVSLFDLTAPPGSYELRVVGSVLAETRTTIEIRDVEERQEFTILAQAR